jgi:hypothetical protein
VRREPEELIVLSHGVDDLAAPWAQIEKETRPHNVLARPIKAFVEWERLGQSRQP